MHCCKQILLRQNNQFTIGRKAEYCLTGRRQVPVWHLKLCETSKRSRYLLYFNSSVRTLGTTLQPRSSYNSYQRSLPEPWKLPPSLWRVQVNSFKRMTSVETSRPEILCHHLTTSPNEAWDELKGSQTVENVQPLPSDLPVLPNAVRFVCMADTHSLTWRLKFPVPPGDVFLHAGDFTRRGSRKEVEDFNKFLGSLPHKHKIVIAGNHELTFDPSCRMGASIPQCRRSGPTVTNIFAKTSEDIRECLTNCVYLEDSATQVYGLTVYGSPWQPEFNDWAFNLPRGEALLKVWNRIPPDIDVLLTHGPPIGHGDFTISGLRAGCVELLLTVQQRVKPKYHVFGHIHEGYGITTDGQTVFVNCSTCNLHYEPVNQPIIFDIPLKNSKKL